MTHFENLEHDPTLHSKYGYNFNEKILMAVITAITNLWQIPGCMELYRGRHYYHFFISFLTMTTSFMYHLLDSLDIPELFFDEGHWHRLDNLGAICCFILLMVQLMNNQDDKYDEILNYIGFIIAVILQEGYPWNLEFTLIPINIFVGILIYKYIKYGKQVYQSYHPLAIFKGCLYLFIAVICFSKGLDEFQDYLRFYHGLWHFFVAMAAFYLFQVKHPKNEEIVYFTSKLTADKVVIKII